MKSLTRPASPQSVFCCPTPYILPPGNKSECIMLYNILISYLRIFSKPRYESHQLAPDGSDLLDCLAYGFSKLIEEIEARDDIVVCVLAGNERERCVTLESRVRYKIAGPQSS